MENGDGYIYVTIHRCNWLHKKGRPGFREKTEAQPPLSWRWYVQIKSALQILDHRGNAQPAAAAGTEKAVPPALTDQMPYGEHAHPGAGRPVGMPERNGAAQGIPFFHIDFFAGLIFDLFDHRKVLDCKGTWPWAGSPVLRPFPGSSSKEKPRRHFCPRHFRP